MSGPPPPGQTSFNPNQQPIYYQPGSNNNNQAPGPAMGYEQAHFTGPNNNYNQGSGGYYPSYGGGNNGPPEPAGYEPARFKPSGEGGYAPSAYDFQQPGQTNYGSGGPPEPAGFGQATFTSNQGCAPSAYDQPPEPAMD